jgi:hypothetical protein
MHTHNYSYTHKDVLLGFYHASLIGGNTDNNVLNEVDTDTNVLYDLIAVKLPEVGDSLTSLRLCVFPHDSSKPVCSGLQESYEAAAGAGVILL